MHHNELTERVFRNVTQKLLRMTSPVPVYMYVYTFLSIYQQAHLPHRNLTRLPTESVDRPHNLITRDRRRLMVVEDY